MTKNNLIKTWADLKAYENVLNIANNLGNVNQNHNKLPPTPTKAAVSKRGEITNTGEDVGKGNSCALLVGM